MFRISLPIITRPWIKPVDRSTTSSLQLTACSTGQRSRNCWHVLVHACVALGPGRHIAYLYIDRSRLGIPNINEVTVIVGRTLVPVNILTGRLNILVRTRYYVPLSVLLLTRETLAGPVLKSLTFR